ncbi:MAG: GNAT family N-acetyltransferase [Saprospiraceae bacterium]|nr:GNAT family N-acetyltransferase [Saprospiraceae bacterium]
MEITIEKFGVESVDLLLEVGLMTFSAAFEAYNHPDDYRTYISKAFDMEVLKAELSNEASEFYFAKQNSEIAGYLKLNHPPALGEDMGDNSLEIQRIYSLPAFYGKGIGEAMMEKSIAVAKENNYDFIWLGVWEHNPRAIRFYQKKGFEVFGNHPFLFGSDLQTDLLMRRFL